MIDPDLIDAIAKEGLKLLYQSGLLKKQIERERERLIAGDVDESTESIAATVKKLRQTVVMLESLHELGASFVKENEQ